MKKNVLFVYRNVLGIPHIDFGIASLSAFLKSKDYKVGLIDYTFGLSDKKAVKLAKNFKPDIICFSSRSNEFESIVKTAEMFKKELKVPIFCGGTHPTIAPEDALRDCFDGICRGEGEEALLELLENIEKDYSKTENFWFKKNREIIKNPLRPLIKNLDEIHLFDYELFDIKKYLNAKDGQLEYMSIRGCPFRCSYCINHVLQDLYKGRGNYIRAKSVDKVIEELKYLKNKYKIKSLFFIDEIFNISDERLKEFSEKYPKEINIPFECSVRANLCNEKNMEYLKQANCSKVCIAIESGDEKLRKELLDKNISDEEIINAFKLAKKYKIHSLSYNMIGLPLEKPEQIEKTIELNKKAEVGSIQVSIFIPFVGTKIYEFCKKNNLLLNRMDISYYFGIYLKNPYLNPKNLEYYRKWFSYKCYEDRSKLKATLLLFRDILIPYYLKYGRHIPLWYKKLNYRLFWNTDKLKFIGK